MNSEAMEWHAWNVVKGGTGSYDVLSGICVVRCEVVHAQVCMYVYVSVYSK